MRPFPKSRATLVPAAAGLLAFALIRVSVAATAPSAPAHAPAGTPPAATRPTPAAPRPSVELQRSADGEVSFTWRMSGEPEVNWSRGADHRFTVRYPGGDTPLQAGRADIDESSVHVGVPASGALSVEATVLSEEVIPVGGEPAPIPASVVHPVAPRFPGTSRAPAPDPAMPDPRLAVGPADSPSAAASLGGVTVIRGLRVAGVIVRPIRYDPVRRELHVAHAIQVTVRCAGSGAAALSSSSSPGGEDALLGGLVVNWQSARRWRSGTDSSFETPARRPAAGGARTAGARTAGARTAGDYFDSSVNWCRIEVNATGLYTITYDDLHRAGIDPPERIEPTTLRLFNGGGVALPESLNQPRRDWMDEVAIEVTGDSTSFGTGDRIFFRGLGPNGYAVEYDPSQGWNYVQHPYSTVNVYWLTWEEGTTPSPFSGTPRRIATRSTGSAVGDPALAVTTFPEHLHYEQNTIENFITPDGDGWYWINFEQLSRVKSVLAVHPDAVTGDPVELKVGMVGQEQPLENSLAYHYARISVDDPTFTTNLVGVKEWRAVSRATFDSTSTWFRDSTAAGVVPRPDSSYIWIEVAASDSCRTPPCDTTGDYYSRSVYLDAFDLSYTRLLRAEGSELQFTAPPDSSGLVEFAVSGFADTTALRVWDVTYPESIQSVSRRAVSGPPGSWTVTVRDSLPVGGPTHRYLATTLAHFQRPATLRFYPRDQLPEGLAGQEFLRRRTDKVNYLIIAPQSLLPAANTLAAYRATDVDPNGDPMRVAVVTTDAVMDEFGWGLMDPTALRDFVKYVYENWTGGGGHSLDYLLLLGATTKDFLNRDGVDDPVQVPSYEGRYRMPRQAGDYETDFASDDWFAYMAPRDSVPAFAVGRIPLRSLDDAQRFVQKTISYETNPEWGDWRSRVILSADDVNRPGGQLQTEEVHTRDTEDLAVNYIPPEAEITKVYETEFPDHGGVKPEAAQALKNAIDDGALFLNYIGHGDETRLADERLLQWDGTWTPANGKREPVMVILSCSVAKFDISSPALAEILLNLDEGGLSAALGSTFLAFVQYNRYVGQRFYTRVYETRPVRRLGIAAWMAKSDVVLAGTDYTKYQTERYVVLGDPALKLAWPRDEVRFDAAVTSDSLIRRGKGFVKGMVYTGAGAGDSLVSNFNGQATLLVHAAADTDGYTYSLGHIDYTIPGPPVFWGHLGTEAGNFGVGVVPHEGEFFVAADAPAGRLGRIGVYAYDPALGIDAAGSIPALPVSNQIAVGDSLAADSLGPSITIVDAQGQQVLPSRPLLLGSPLTAVISDPHGVNATGADPFFALAFRLDGGDWVDLTRGFRVDAGGYTTGRVALAFPSTTGPGEHQLEVRAADNLNNRSDLSTRIVLATSEEFRLGYVFGYPNPFTQSTVVVYELTREADVTVKIYTTAGRLIRTLHESGLPGQNRTMVWDGRDEAGDPVANGVYLVKLDAKDLDSGGASYTATTRLARVR